jgi:hypothetical protein
VTTQGHRVSASGVSDELLQATVVVSLVLPYDLTTIQNITLSISYSGATNVIEGSKAIEE